MGTKNRPGCFDCYANAEPDEPMFVLLARDERAPAAIIHWVLRRAGFTEALSVDGEPWPVEDVRKLLDDEGKLDDKASEALDCVDSMNAWRASHRGT